VLTSKASSAIHLAKELGAMDEPRWRACHALTTRTSAMLVALVRRCG
jgi:hypothetical protein